MSEMQMTHNNALNVMIHYGDKYKTLEAQKYGPDVSEVCYFQPNREDEKDPDPVVTMRLFVREVGIDDDLGIPRYEVVDMRGSYVPSVCR